MFWNSKNKETEEVELDIFTLITELETAALSEKERGSLFHWQRYIWAVAIIRHLMYQRDKAIGLLEQGEIDLNRGSRKIREEYYSFKFAYPENDSPKQ